MSIEHIGLSVPDSHAMADWYVKNLGFTELRRGGNRHDGVSFILDQSGRTILELFNLPGVPPLRPDPEHPLQLHLAIDCDDPHAKAIELVEAGAEFIGEAPRNEYQGEKYLVRDPWGTVLQVVNRKRKLRSG